MFDLLIILSSFYISLCTLFFEPMVDKLRAGKLEGNSASLGTADVFFSPGWRSSRSSRLAILSPLRADLMDTAERQQ